ncbi:PREDICTED: kinesin-like protein KIN-12D [Tarenaya hassleriana]|uniref:kinesin-like protein KIN-12D n=1 Tax=Tarenaya hassleriana TaxID=28532 RepID=UPI00053C877D|nr:PREDICTED: kinesin-like protein KIN-12D [Tarenaya hassleriana]
MLRDFKFLRRNSGQNEEIENVPVNLRESMLSQMSNDSSSSIPLPRAPLNSIQDPLMNPKPEKESRSKIERTPTKPRAKNPDPALPLKTPDRQKSANFSRSQFRWGEKGDSSSNTNVGSLNMTPKTTRVVGRANSGYSETNSTQSTPTKSISKPPASGYRGRVDGSGPVRVGGNASSYRGMSGSSGHVSTVINSVEVPHFDLKEDPSFWMDHNVQILIRVRPLNTMEKSTNGYNRCLKQESSQIITWVGQPETRFMFDHVACETIDQETLFRVAGLPMVENCLSGYNSCIFAYGQTGSGKTYTMLGEVDELEVKPSPHRGMMPRIFEFLFARIQAEEESRRDERLKYNCKCSFLEIYNEQITDLLDPCSTNLQLREDIKEGVYVENLTEYEVQSVQGILKLISQGSLNRRVGATNMNRESSRSHSVFTCVIESRWENDSTTNLRFARLNLVDLAGSERQKTSGAEGERLKEAANINKSLSTLGHVIMVLADVANGKPRHIPYRDSRLTFLLQDSLGGNSKTMIIANASPSINCAAETLNTLKFAQRAKLIKNNAVVNEDSTWDVMALQHEIRLLKEELSLLRHQNVSRALSFGSARSNVVEVQTCLLSCGMNETGNQQTDDLNVYESGGSLRMSRKQFKSLEKTLAGALRREHVADASIKKLEAEIEQLNRLARQREEDTRSTKMMLRFREDKIRKLESLLGNHISADSFLQEENKVLSEEIQLLQAKLDKNPEVTRFASENIRLLEQLRRFQEFYEEGEREILLDEVSNLRDQLLQFLDGNSVWHEQPDFQKQSQDASCISKEDSSLNDELKNALSELEECRSHLGSCLEENAKLSREIRDLQAMISNIKACTPDEDEKLKTTKALFETQNAEIQESLAGHQISHEEEIIKLQLDFDILKIILDEERMKRVEAEKQAMIFKQDLLELKGQLLMMSKQQDNANCDLQEAKSVIEALESQNVLSIQEIEDLGKNTDHYLELIKKQGFEITEMKAKQCNELKDNPPENYTMDTKFKKMQESLEKARRLNALYKSDIRSKTSSDKDMDEVHRQAEAATAEVIICLQNELEVLQKEVEEFQSKETASQKQVMLLETQVVELQDKLRDMTEDNDLLEENLQEKDTELQILSHEVEILTSELEEILLNGNEALADACSQVDLISSSFPEKRVWISEQVGGLARVVCEKELMIEDLQSCLEDANNKRYDVESMLKSLRGAALVINEAHQRECEEKERQILLLKSQLNTKTESVSRLQENLKMAESKIYEASHCATAALVVVSRYSHVADAQTCELNQKDSQLKKSAGEILSLRKQVEDLEVTCNEFKRNLLEAEKHAYAMEQNLENIKESEILRMNEKLSELKGGISGVRSCMSMSHEPDKYGKEKDSLASPAHSDAEQETRKDVCVSSCTEKKTPHNKQMQSAKVSNKAASGRDETILLLKGELESAFGSLQEFQFKMVKLQSEKEELRLSEQRSISSLKDVTAQILNLESAMNNMEEQYKSKMEVTDHKVKALEHEFAEMKILADQEDAENLCILTKFEEAQFVIKEADTMINELVIANEEMKLDLERHKKKEITLVSERDVLVDKLHGLESKNVQEKEKFEKLEKQLELSFMETNILMDELEAIIRKLQDDSSKALLGIGCEFSDIKSWISETRSARLFLEDIWSEIIMKDCAFSVLHLCHTGILLETVVGMNTENGLLHHGLSESNSAIAELRENNLKLRRELEMCRTLRRKLLADIKKGFERISRKEEETNQLGSRLSTFELNISGLQQQEELMLQRSNSIGSELADLMKELDFSNRNLASTLFDQELRLKDQDHFFDTEMQFYLMEFCSKDVASLVLALTLEESFSSIAVAGRELLRHHAAIENHKEELFVSHVENQLKELCLVDNEFETGLLKQKLGEALGKVEGLSLDLNHSEQKIIDLKEANEAYKERVILFESCIANLQNDLQMKSSELNSLEHLQIATKEELEVKVREEKFKDLSTTRLCIAKCEDLAESLNIRASGVVVKLSGDGLVIFDKMFQLICESADKTSKLVAEVESLQLDIQEILSDNMSLHDELLRKDEVIKGLSFDLSLLQESASNSRDQKDEIEEILAHVEALEEKLASKSCELDEAISRTQMLEGQLLENREVICDLEADIAKEREYQETLSRENEGFRDKAGEAFRLKCSLEEELIETKKVSESLEIELVELSDALRQMNGTVEMMHIKLDEATDEKDNLREEVLYLKEEFGKLKAEAKETEMRYIEAQEIAEARKIYADEREQEVKLLEESVEKLEYTVNLLENKVDVIKGEAERQRLQREELESEFQTINQQMRNAMNTNAEMRRLLDKKQKDLEEALNLIKMLERDMADQTTEIAQLKVHISELTLHAEAQAVEYKKKFKELEAMSEQAKPESHVSHSTSCSSSKTSAKPRGSGSPFRCIGLGMAQQMKSEKDEEIAAARLRIEELESEVATRQKEIFSLNARFATVESMTHDVIRDLLGVKLNVTNCASLLDNHQVLKIAEKVQLDNSDSQQKDNEVSKLKKQLNEYIEERQGWIEEIERKQAELVAAEIELEKHRQHEQLFKKENELLKTENVSHKRKVLELEGEVKKLSAQQNLQRKAHDHAKIKEENNMLKLQNDELNLKLRRAGVILSRVKEELAYYRASSGKNPCPNLEEDQRLSNRLKEAVEDRMQLARKLVGLCTSVLKAAGIKEHVSDINPEVAEEALAQLKTKLTSLESELQELRLKGKTKSRRTRISETMPQVTSPRSSWTDENHHIPYLSSLDR